MPDESTAHHTEPTRVAIIGAGIAGASAAFKLFSLAEDCGSECMPSITIFERQSQVGGRVKSFRPPKRQNVVYETGASYFSQNDWCMVRAMEDVGLKPEGDRYGEKYRSSGLWNGESLTTPAPSCNPVSSWWNIIASTWKYGLSPWRYRRVLSSALYNWQGFTIRSHTSVQKAVEGTDLHQAALLSAESYLRDEGISSRFISEVVQPCSRMLFTQNPANVTGLAALTATSPGKQIRVAGGNFRLIDRLIKLSGAELRLETQVTKISQTEDERYRVSTVENNGKGEDTLREEDFDFVFIATPLVSNAINLDDVSSDSIPVATEYAEAYVTIVSTPKTMNLHPSGISIPDDLLTTTSSDENPAFSSISREDLWCPRGCFGCDADSWEKDNVYRIVTRQPLKDRDIILAIGENYDEGLDITDHNMTWVHREAWPNAFPKFTSGKTERKIEIAPGLFYLSAGEELVPSMEMACRMGSNAAEILHWSGYSSRNKLLALDEFAPYFPPPYHDDLFHEDL